MIGECGNEVGGKEVNKGGKGKVKKRAEGEWGRTAGQQQHHRRRLRFGMQNSHYVFDSPV